MRIIIGLGNPGKKFEKTRHNLGFKVIENLKLLCGNSGQIENFSDWKYEKKFQTEISQGRIDKQKIILAKPQTFMNNSGKAAKLLIRRYSLAANNLIVIHDDIDLPLGKVRISINRSAAGHKGVQSIIEELKTKNFIRFRVGIKSKKIENRRPTVHTQKKIEDFVLERFNKDEEKFLKEVVKKTVEAIELTIREGLEKAMNDFNK